MGCHLAGLLHHLHAAGAGPQHPHPQPRHVQALLWPLTGVVAQPGKVGQTRQIRKQRAGGKPQAGNQESGVGDVAVGAVHGPGACGLIEARSHHA